MTDAPDLQVPSPQQAVETSQAVRPARPSRFKVKLLWAGIGLSVLAAASLLAALSANSSGRSHASSGLHEGWPDGGDSVSLISLNTVTPRQKTLTRVFEQPATIRPRAQAELYARVPGYLKRIAREPLAGEAGALGPEKDIGSIVRAGEVLIEVDAPDLHQEVVQKESMWMQAQAELERSRADLAAYQATIDLETRKLQRLRDLARSRTVTEELVDEKKAELAVASSKLAAAQADIVVRESRVRVARDELERARILASFTQLHAPFDGVITYRGVDEGDFIQNASTGQPRPLMTVAAIDKVKLILQLPERESIWVELGAEAAVEVDARAGWRGKGRVARVGPVLDSQTRTRQVEIDLDNQDRRLLPGMYGQVTVTLQRFENAQAIPATAVFSRRGENHIIQVVDGVARRQRVRIRFDNGKELEVARLVEGKELPLIGSEELVVSNKGEIADGQRVKASRLNAP